MTTPLLGLAIRRRPGFSGGMDVYSKLGSWRDYAMHLHSAAFELRDRQRIPLPTGMTDQFMAPDIPQGQHAPQLLSGWSTGSTFSEIATCPCGRSPLMNNINPNA